MDKNFKYWLSHYITEKREISIEKGKFTNKEIFLCCKGALQVPYPPIPPSRKKGASIPIKTVFLTYIYKIAVKSKKEEANGAYS